MIQHIANFRDHLRRWAKQNGHDPNEVNRAVDASRPLQWIEDLSNNDKHGYPPRDGGRSGIAPRLQEINRVLRMTTGAAPGSAVAFRPSTSGPVISASGGGGVAVVITGVIVDASDAVLGDLYAVELEAIEVWEGVLRRLTSSDSGDAEQSSE